MSDTNNSINNPIAPSRILLIDDTPATLDILVSLLHSEGFEVSTAINAVMALEAVARIVPDLILLDIMMDTMDGYELCEQLKADNFTADIPVIFISALASSIDKLRAFAVGGVDYICKPFCADEILARVRTHLELRNAYVMVQQQNEKLKHEQIERKKTEQELGKYQKQISGLLSQQLQQPQVFNAIVTKSEKMFSIFQYIEALACSEEPVQILGESGVGKELIAKAVHQVCSPDAALVAVNIASFDDNQFSSSLFGHVKGAFTGADHERSGLIAQAAGGTLFMDEIGDLSLESQIKLLRVLQEKEYLPLGSDVALKVDTRIIVATNVDLEQMVRKKQFREDLYYRLSVHRITVPPLRERMEDIPLLLDHYLAQAAVDFKKKKPSYPKELPLLLANYHFPGNIRELRAMIFDAMSRHKSKMLSMETFKGLMFPCERVSLQSSSHKKVIFSRELPSLKEVASLLVDEAIERTDGNQSMAAKLIGVTPAALSLRLKAKSK